MYKYLQVSVIWLHNSICFINNKGNKQHFHIARLIKYVIIIKYLENSSVIK
jgi:hypothetical protein